MLYNNMLIYVDIIIFLVLHILFIDTPQKNSIPERSHRCPVCKSSVTVDSPWNNPTVYSY